MCGISEHVGHALCHCVHNPKTGKIICRSHCREITPNDPNFRAKQRGGEEDLSREFIKRKALQKIGIIAAGTPEDDRDDKSMQSDAQCCDVLTPHLWRAVSSVIGVHYVIFPCK